MQIRILDVNISIITDSNKNCKKKRCLWVGTMYNEHMGNRLLKVHKDKKEHIRDIELG